MSNDEPTTVWLLGAGFSKPLGGPLFAEVLSEPYMRAATAWIAVQLAEHKEVVQGMQLAARFFDDWLDQQWRDAEDFLDVLERTKGDRGTELMVQQLLRGTRIEWERQRLPTSLGDSSRALIAQGSVSDDSLDIDDLRKRSQQLVAATTSAFLASTDRDDERLELYARWFSRLGSNDTIVSLNYDRVVEHLAESTGNTAPRVIKLHGTVPPPEKLLARIAANDEVPEIGLPGPGKRKVAGAAWEEVRQALRVAQRFVAIGYSFPQTDVSVAGLVVRELVACDQAWIVAGGNGAPIKDLMQVVVDDALDTGELCERFLLKLTRKSSGFSFVLPKGV